MLLLQGEVSAAASETAAWAAGTSAGTVKPPQVTAVDATAAGDSFCAGLAIALAEGADWPNAV